MKQADPTERVFLRELGPREGFQNLSQVVPTPVKAEAIAKLVATGVPEIEVTAFVRADKVPQMADAEVLVEQLPVPPAGQQYVALCLNPKGLERAARFSAKLLLRGWVTTAMSEPFLRANSNQSIEDSISSVLSWREVCDRVGVPLYGLLISTAFGDSFGARPTASEVCALIERFGQVAGSIRAFREVVLADTVGRAHPLQVRELVTAVRERFPDLLVTLHLHDTTGCGMANVLAGFLAGVRTFECSVGGVGGCPFASGAAGNVATEDVAFMLREMVAEVGVDLERYRAAAQFFEGIVGTPLPGRWYRSKYRAG